MKDSLPDNFGLNLISGQAKSPFARERRGWIEGVIMKPKVSGEKMAGGGALYRFLPFYIAVLVLFFVFVARLLVLSIFSGSHYLALSEGNRLRLETTSAERGVITDRSGAILARNRPGFKVVLKKETAVTDALINRLAEILDLTPGALRDRLRDHADDLPEGIIVKRDLSQEEVVKIETDAALSPIGQISVEPVRDYLYPKELAHVLGYLGEISPAQISNKGNNSGYLPSEIIGQEGLESVYDSYLKGRSGRRLLEMDARGKIVKESAKEPAISGFNLKTNLSLPLQQLAFTALTEAMEKTGATGGAIVGTDPQTGEVLVLVSLPSFNPNLFSSGLSAADYQQLIDDPGKPLFNRAIMAAYPPGSVFKLVTGAAGLSEDVVNEQTVIYDTGLISSGDFSFRDWLPGGHGPITFVDALAKSCDTYFYVVGGGYLQQSGLGIDKLADWCQRYHRALGNRRHQLTIEYLLLGGFNDTPADAAALVKFLKAADLPKVNLIIYNAIPGKSFQSSDQEAIDDFRALLRSHQVTVTTRRSLGTDISAACGQLVINKTS